MTSPHSGQADSTIPQPRDQQAHSKAGFQKMPTDGQLIFQNSVDGPLGVKSPSAILGWMPLDWLAPQRTTARYVFNTPTTNGSSLKKARYLASRDDMPRHRAMLKREGRHQAGRRQWPNNLRSIGRACASCAPSACRLAEVVFLPPLVNNPSAFLSALERSR